MKFLREMMSVRAAGLLTLLLLLPPGTALAAPAQVDCEDYYYGIRRPVDFPKALRCFEKDKSWEMLIVMHLNGEGTPASVPKAEALLRSWRQADSSEPDSLQREALQKIVDERKQHPGGPFPRIDFCQDIAGDTVTMNSCAALGEEIEKARLESRLAEIGARLTPAQAAVLRRLAAELELFKKADGRRMYQQYIEGTIRGLASSGQETFVRENFSSLLQDTVEHRGLQAADRQAYEAADRELNQVYREDLASYGKDFEPGAQGQESREDRERRLRYIAEYKKDSKDAQLRWIRYRDLWVELASQLYVEKKDGFDPALSMKTAVTRARIRELRNDPVGPGGDAEEQP